MTWEFAIRTKVVSGVYQSFSEVNGTFVYWSEIGPPAPAWRIHDATIRIPQSDGIDSGKKICLMELGVGFNTPTIIRFPFEKLMREHRQISLIRLNLNEAVVPESFGARAVGINADMKHSIEEICRLCDIGLEEKFGLGNRLYQQELTETVGPHPEGIIINKGKKEAWKRKI